MFLNYSSSYQPASFNHFDLNLIRVSTFKKYNIKMFRFFFFFIISISKLCAFLCGLLCKNSSSKLLMAEATREGIFCS